MAIIHERSLFSWKDFQNDVQHLGDLERLKLIIETLPDQKLINTLSILRGNGRNIRCGLALSVMLAIALGRLRQEHPELMRSLIKAA